MHKKTLTRKKHQVKQDITSNIGRRQDLTSYSANERYSTENRPGIYNHPCT